MTKAYPPSDDPVIQAAVAHKARLALIAGASDERDADAQGLGVEPAGDDDA